MKKKIFSVFLSLALCLSVIPETVYAAESGETESDPGMALCQHELEYILQEGDTYKCDACGKIMSIRVDQKGDTFEDEKYTTSGYYTDLQTAINAVGDYGKIWLLQDIDLNGDVRVDRRSINLYLYLNKHTLTLNDSDFRITGGTVYFLDTDDENGGAPVADGGAVVSGVGEGRIVLSGSSSNDCIWQRGSKTAASLENVSILVEKGKLSLYNGTLSEVTQTGGYVGINGGKVEALEQTGGETSVNLSGAIDSWTMSQDAEANLYGGTVGKLEQTGGEMNMPWMSGYNDSGAGVTLTDWVMSGGESEVQYGTVTQLTQTAGTVTLSGKKMSDGTASSATMTDWKMNGGEAKIQYGTVGKLTQSAGTTVTLSNCTVNGTTYSATVTDWTIKGGAAGTVGAEAVINDGTVATLEQNAGNVTINGGTVTTLEQNAGNTKMNGGTAVTWNVNDGNADVDCGTVTTLKQTGGALRLFSTAGKAGIDTSVGALKVTGGSISINNGLEDCVSSIGSIDFSGTDNTIGGVLTAGYWFKDQDGSWVDAAVRKQKGLSGKGLYTLTKTPFTKTGIDLQYYGADFNNSASMSGLKNLPQTFTASFTGEPLSTEVSYRWYIDGVAQAGETGETFTPENWTIRWNEDETEEAPHIIRCDMTYGDYTEQAECEFTVLRNDLGNWTRIVYAGTENPSVTYTPDGHSFSKGDFTVLFGRDSELVSSENFKLYLRDAEGNDTGDGETVTVTDSGTYQLVFKAVGKVYRGEKVVNMTVNPKEISADKLTLTLDERVTGADIIYNGSAFTPAVECLWSGGYSAAVLLPESEYTVRYTDNVDAGTATVTVTNKEGGNYTINGSATCTFIIQKAALTGAAVSMDSYAYADIPSVPTVTGAPEDAVAEYYYNTENSNENGTKWENMTGESLSVGTYYLYAQLSEMKNYTDCTTEPVSFSVTKAAPPVSEWPVIREIYVNDTLTDADMTGGSSALSGSFTLTGEKSWTTDGEKTTAITFTLAEENAQYNRTASREVTVQVRKRVAETVAALTPVTDQTCGTALEKLGLPETVSLTTADGKTFENVPVVWSGYDAETTAAQTLTGSLDLSAIADEVEQPAQPVTAAITVTLQERQSGNAGSGDAGTGDGGNAGTGDSGSAGSGDSGNAGTGEGGNAGSGDAGTGEGGNAGSGDAGTGEGGSAGSGESGNAGSVSGNGSGDAETGNSGSTGNDGESNNAGTGNSGNTGNDNESNNAGTGNSGNTGNDNGNNNAGSGLNVNGGTTESASQDWQNVDTFLQGLVQSVMSSITAFVEGQAADGADGTDAESGVNVNIHVSGETGVPVNVLQTISGTGLTLAMQQGNGVALSISGGALNENNLSGVQTIDLTTDPDAAAIPEELTSGRETENSRQLAIRDTGRFAVPVGLHVGMGEENAGRYANFYRYNEAENRLEYCGSFRITENGQAMLTLQQGGSYFVNVTDEIPQERYHFQAASGDYTVQRGDSLSKIARRFRMSLAELLKKNPDLADPNSIRAGQRINVD